jgi:hypothetical protein
VSDEPETPADKVKRAMSRKRPVTDAPIEVTRGKTTLKVHEGGKAPRKPRKKKPTAEEPYALYGDTPPPEGEPDRPDDGGHQPPDAPPEDLEKAKDCAVAGPERPRQCAPADHLVRHRHRLCQRHGLADLARHALAARRGRPRRAAQGAESRRLHQARGGMAEGDPLQQRVLDAGELARKKNPTSAPSSTSARSSGWARSSRR